MHNTISEAGISGRFNWFMDRALACEITYDRCEIQRKKVTPFRSDIRNIGKYWEAYDWSRCVPSTNKLCVNGTQTPIMRCFRSNTEEEVSFKR